MPWVTQWERQWARSAMLKTVVRKLDRGESSRSGQPVPGWWGILSDDNSNSAFTYIVLWSKQHHPKSGKSTDFAFKCRFTVKLHCHSAHPSTCPGSSLSPTYFIYYLQTFSFCCCCSFIIFLSSLECKLQDSKDFILASVLSPAIEKYLTHSSW